MYGWLDGATVTKLPDAKPLYLVVIPMEQKVLSKAIWCRRGFPSFRATFTLS